MDFSPGGFWRTYRMPHNSPTKLWESWLFTHWFPEVLNPQQLQKTFLMWGLSESLWSWRTSSVRGAEWRQCLSGKQLAHGGNIRCSYRGNLRDMGQGSKSVCSPYFSIILCEKIGKKSLLNMVDRTYAFPTPPSWCLSKITENEFKFFYKTWRIKRQQQRRADGWAVTELIG